jgi:hypothetical protein
LRIKNGRQIFIFGNIEAKNQRISHIQLQILLIQKKRLSSIVLYLGSKLLIKWRMDEKIIFDFNYKDINDRRINITKTIPTMKP